MAQTIDDLDLENPLVEGLERLPVHPTSLVVFGATGDLAHRKLLPALYNLAHEGALPERFNLIGVARREISSDDFRADARKSIEKFSRRTPDSTVLDGLLGRAVPVTGWDDAAYARKATGRAALTDGEREHLGQNADRFPLFG